MTTKSNEQLLEVYENAVTEMVKAVNGWNRQSEEKLSRKADGLRAEILKRMAGKERL